MSIAIAKLAIKDHWSTWDHNYVEAPSFNVEAYQQRLNEIAGFSRDQPILKLMWGGSEYITKYYEWDSFGTPQKSHKIPRFALHRKNPILGCMEYIPIRRWIIVERAEPETYDYDDPKAGNVFTNEYGIECQIAEKPRDFYTPYIYVGDHSKCSSDCCKDRICLGDYKIPGVDELDLVLEHTWKAARDRSVNPYGTLSSDEVEQLTKEAEYKRSLLKQKIDDEMDYEAKNWFHVHGHRITEDDPTVLAKGKFKFYKDGKPV